MGAQNWEEKWGRTRTLVADDIKAFIQAEALIQGEARIIGAVASHKSNHGNWIVLYFNGNRAWALLTGIARW